MIFSQSHELEIAELARPKKRSHIHPREEFQGVMQKFASAMTGLEQKAMDVLVLAYKLKKGLDNSKE